MEEIRLSDVVTVGEKKTFWFGDFDDIFIDYDGFRMKNALNLCYNPTYEGATHFKADVDKEVTYTYDANGNLTSDLNLGIRKITYNFLNLPDMVVFEGIKRNSISYTYDADGNKLAVVYSLYKNNRLSLSQMKYMGNHVYKNGKLIRTLTDYGYFDSNNSHHYFIKDYRGDIRAIVDSEGNLEEINSYYPYGMLFGASAVADTQPYKYTGKEFERTRGLDLLDFGARFYSPAATKTTTMDPLCEKFYSVSPYTWCNGNPIKNVDTDGKIVANIVGGVVGGLVEYGSQVIGNIAENGLSSESFTDIDYGDIAIAAAEGFITSGGSVVKNAVAKTAVHVASSVVSNAIDIKADGIKVNSVEKTVRGIAIDAASSLVKIDLADIKILKTPTANKAVKSARSEAHAMGNSLSGEQAKKIAKNTRENNVTKKEINNISNATINELLGNFGGAATKGYFERNDKENQ